MRNEYIIDWPLLKSWTIESQHRGVRLVFFIVWCLFFVGSFVLGMIFTYNNMYSNALFFALMALFSFYRAFIMNILIAKRQYNRLAQTFGKDSWLARIVFDDNGILLKEEKTEMHFDYSDIQEIVEKKDMVCLILQAKAVIRLYKSKFIDCTWEDCKTKIIQNNPNLKSI